MHPASDAPGGDQAGRVGPAAAAGLAAMDFLVVAGVWVAAARLGDWGWTVRGLAVLGIGWGLTLAVATWLRSRQSRQASLLEALVGLAVLAVAWWQYPPLQAGWETAAYGFMVVAVALAGWRSWHRRMVDAGGDALAEPLRVLLLAGVAIYVMLPLFTHRFLGGTDARWYALMLHDFIEQWRFHGPPVFIGQGEYVWNGAIHPFRSAPAYMHLAGLWDWLTFGSLATPALQHLTAITAALAAAWGAYAAAVKLAPGRRWEGAAVAAVFVLSPAVLMPLYASDAYMTYLASAAFVGVVYGNVRVLTDGRGWLVLAASLSLAWMCHPPTAMQATLISAVLQLGGLAFGPGGWIEWRKAFAAAGWFGGLSLYYFMGMAELPAVTDGDMASSVAQVIALALGCFFGGRTILARRVGWGTLWLVPAVLVLWLVGRVWLGWLVVTLALLGGTVVVGRRFWRFDPVGFGPIAVLIAALVAAVFMDLALRSGWIAADSYPAHSRQHWGNLWSDNIFRPLSPHLQVEGDFQPGWGLWLAGLGAVFAAGRRGARAAQLVLGASVLISFAVLPWPRVAEFALGFLPMDLVKLTGLYIELRVLPVLAALLLGCGWLAVRATQNHEGRWGRRLVGWLLLFMVGWAGWQARYFVQRGFSITAPAAIEARYWRSENAPMDRFVYDLLFPPSYYSHGKMDPNLEVRLFDDRGGLIYGPAQATAAMEAAGSETLDLTVHPIPGHPRWHQLEPGFTVQPGERRLVRFAFDPARTYDGHILFVSPHGYREYMLPESGMTRSFGTGPDHSRVLSFWNSGREPEPYRIQFQIGSGHDLQPGMKFAQVTLSAWRSELARIRLESLNPWRVRTDLPAAGRLETPRVFLPGYRVWVDGVQVNPAAVSASPDGLLQVAVPPGDHEVVVRYVGTAKLRIAGVVSGAVWLAALAGIALGDRTRRFRFLSGSGWRLSKGG